MPAVSLSQKVEKIGLSLVTVGDRVEVRKGQKVISFGTSAEKAVAKAMERLEEERLRDLDKTPEDVAKMERKTEALLEKRAKATLLEKSLIAHAAVEALDKPVPVKGAYEGAGGTIANIDYPATPTGNLGGKSVVKAKYRDKYKANGYNCGDMIAEELQAYVCVLRGSRLMIDQAKLKEVAMANGAWEDRYEALNVGLRRMSIGNRLRNKFNNGDKIDIGGCVFEKQFD